MVAAGVEGGSKSRIESEWGLLDVKEQQSFWLRNGPPSHIVLMQIAGALGIRFEAKQMDDASSPEIQAPTGGVSISELSAMVSSPRDIGGTMEASRSINALLNSGGAT